MTIMPTAIEQALYDSLAPWHQADLDALYKALDKMIDGDIEKARLEKAQQPETSSLTSSGYGIKEA